MHTLELGRLDEVANSILRSSTKMAAVQGAGFGLGGLLTVVPDLGLLSAITMRTIQKLSLIYGFQFNTDDEMAELWIAAASAAGVDISRELLEKEVINKFIPRVIQRIAAQGQWGSRREMGGPPDPGSQFADRRSPELLFRAHLGTSRRSPLPAKASGGAAKDGARACIFTGRTRS